MATKLKLLLKLLPLSGWHIHYGRWWCLQWSLNWWFSIGIHIDFKRRQRAMDKIYYGPYIDIHLGCCILSVGNNPVYSSEFEKVISISRGGI